jgi:MFS superfamily sulfate permease-like transporter
VLNALRPSTSRPRLIVLEATGILDIDFTAAQILGDVIRRCRADGIAFTIARLESIRAQEAVARFGIEEVLGRTTCSAASRRLSARLAGQHTRRMRVRPHRNSPARQHVCFFGATLPSGRSVGHGSYLGISCRPQLPRRR